MPLDPSIILGAKPVQFDMAQFSPMNALTNVMKFKQADQETQLNALKMREYERTREEEQGLRERLARHHHDPDSAFYGWNGIWLDPAFRAWNISAELSSIQCPLLAIQGLDDEYGSMQQIHGIRDQVDHTTLLELPACGHSPHKDQPLALSKAVIAFVVSHTAQH